MTHPKSALNGQPAKAFYSSPLRAHFGNRHQAALEAVQGMARLRPHFVPVFSVRALREADFDAVLSPIIIGEAREFDDEMAIAWCLDLLRTECNSLIDARTIARVPDVPCFCDEEIKGAEGLSYPVWTDLEIEQWDR